MIEQYKVEEFVYSSLQKPKRRGHGYVARCPICGDSQKNPNMRRLNIDFYPRYDEWIYKCYNGGCPENAGNIQSLYAHVHGVTWKEANEALGENKKYDSDELKDKLDGRKKFDDSVDEQGVLDLELGDCISFDKVPDGRVEKNYHSALKRFIVDRQIPLRRNVMVAFKGRYQNRFILPVYQDNELVYFQGRAMFDHMFPKYMNPVVVKDKIVLNKEYFDPDKYIIVCEGQIDAWMVEYNQGTTCLGASISDDFLGNVSHMTRKGIICALDNPKIDKSGYENYIKLLEKSRYGQQVKYFFMPNDTDKDLNDVRVREGNAFNIYDFVVENSYNSFKTSMMMNNVV
jgi:hypothetical protein